MTTAATPQIETTETWWANINTLALVQTVQSFIRNSDGPSYRADKERFNSHIIGAARAIGVPEDRIREACASDAELVIYAP